MQNVAELKQKKPEIVKKFARSTKDTGSPEVQVALITERINHLNGHFKTNPKDHCSNRGLLALVGQRRRLLNHLKIIDDKRYAKLIDSLSLRK